MEVILTWAGYICFLLAGVQIIKLIKFHTDEKKRKAAEEERKIAEEAARKQAEAEKRKLAQKEKKRRIQEDKEKFVAEIRKKIEERDKKEKMSVLVAKSWPGIWGISGNYADAFIPLERDILFGRAFNCNLVFPEDASQISRKHCSLKYDDDMEMFCLTDLWSSYGTFLGNGRKMNGGESVWLKENEEFILGDGERFRVVMKAT